MESLFNLHFDGWPCTLQTAPEVFLIHFRFPLEPHPVHQPEPPYRITYELLATLWSSGGLGVGIS